MVCALYRFPCTAGTLTETRVLLSQPQPLSLDRYGFVVPEQASPSTSGRGTAEVRA